jgi:hypothetical protein
MSTDTTTDKRKRTARDTDEKPVITQLMIDYRGTVGRVPGQRAVTHCRSPLIAFLPRDGVMEMAVQPGLSFVPSDVWAAYSTEHPQVLALIKAKRLRKIDRLPTDEDGLLNLIGRTIDPKALEALRAHEESSDEPREVILSAVDRRLATTSSISFECKPYMPRVTLGARLVAQAAV